MSNNEEKGKLAMELHQLIMQNELNRRQLLFANMEHIGKMYHDKLYQVFLGDDTASWSAYMGQFDVFYTKSQVYLMNKIYQKFIKELGLDSKDISDIPHSKLGLLVNLVNKENVHLWLTKSRELTSQDFKDEIRKATGKVSYLACSHQEEVTYKICQTCSHRHRV
jgi:hypothetical protein